MHLIMALRWLKVNNYKMTAIQNCYPNLYFNYLFCSCKFVASFMGTAAICLKDQFNLKSLMLFETLNNNFSSYKYELPTFYGVLNNAVKFS